MGHERELAQVLAEVRRIEAYSKRLVSGVMAGLYSSVFRGTGIEFDEVREYETGDDPRSVDWAVTARVGRPFVKRFVDERQRAVVFVLDLSASMNGGIGPWSARGAAARIIGSLGLAAVASNDLVGLIACGERVERVVPLRKNVRHALRLVRDALVLRAEGDRTDLTPGLEAVVGRVQQRAVVFVLSDFLCDGWQPAMARCARRHDVIAVRLGTPELSAPAAGLVRLRDPEGTGEHSWTLRTGPAAPPMPGTWRAGANAPRSSCEKLAPTSSTSACPPPRIPMRSHALSWSSSGVVRGGGSGHENRLAACGSRGVL